MSKELDLSRDDFDRFLAALDPDRELAGTKYEQLRDRLISFFAHRGSTSPEDLADETMNLVARNIERIVGPTVDLSAYAFGVARRLLHENLRSAKAQAPLIESDAGETDEKERRLQCLEKCFQRLPENSRELISLYYQGKGVAKIENRKMLAERLGISREALTLRNFHIKRVLQKCIRECLEHESPQD